MVVSSRSPRGALNTKAGAIAYSDAAMTAAIRPMCRRTKSNSTATVTSERPMPKRRRAGAEYSPDSSRIPLIIQMNSGSRKSVFQMKERSAMDMKVIASASRSRRASPGRTAKR